MTIAVMQPYFFPYLGYFQLVALADTFVFYDDVNYIKNGWVNRNRVLINGTASYITVQLRGASPFKKINEIRFTDNRPKLIKTLRQAYGKAPSFAEVWPVLENVLTLNTDQLSELAAHSVQDISTYLGLATGFRTSSQDHAPTLGLERTERLLSICRSEEATRYVNALGGRELYDKQDFLAKGIGLSFLRSRLPEYPQAGAPFVPGLSIIDVLMYNDRERVRAMLGEFELL